MVTTDALTTDDPVVETEVSLICNYLPECNGLGLRDEDRCLDDDATAAPTDLCPVDYLNTGKCCLSQWWFIGLSAGAAFVIITTLLIVICCLASRKPKRHHADDVSSVAPLTRADGVENLAYADDANRDSSENGVVMRSHDQASFHKPPLPTPGANSYRVTPTRSRDNSLRQSDYVNNDVTAGNLRERPLSLGSNMYDDITHLQKDDDHEQEYYNVRQPGSAERRHQPEKVLPTGVKQRSSLAAQFDTEPKHKQTPSHGIDLSQFVDFQPNLEHVDPHIDYSIQRPSML